MLTQWEIERNAKIVRAFERQRKQLKEHPNPKQFALQTLGLQQKENTIMNVTSNKNEQTIQENIPFDKMQELHFILFQTNIWNDGSPRKILICLETGREAINNGYVFKRAPVGRTITFTQE